MLPVEWPLILVPAECPGFLCRLSAPEDAPPPLKRQKANKSGLLPPKCPWEYSTATKMAELSIFLFIAAEVPLEGLQRHSNGRNQTN